MVLKAVFLKSKFQRNFHIHRGKKWSGGSENTFCYKTYLLPQKCFDLSPTGLIWTLKVQRFPIRLKMLLLGNFLSKIPKKDRWKGHILATPNPQPFQERKTTCFGTADDTSQFSVIIIIYVLLIASFVVFVICILIFYRQTIREP